MTATQEPESAQSPADAPPELHAPIQTRFLFVDVAAQRAKQLRRGALPRLHQLPPDPETGHRTEMPHKLERIAMEEVRHRLIGWELPDFKARRAAAEE
jgi:DNA-directed RNA polymerase subunit K/omega